jgi:hypothetical protein
VVTAAPAHRLARAVVALAVVGAVSTLGGVASADPTPAPATDVVPVAPADVPEAPATEPSIGSWIIGGTELEGTAAVPAARPAVKPAVKPVARPVAQPAAAPRSAVRTTRTSTRTVSRTTSTTRAAATGGAGISTAVAVDGATALPFTGGGHVDTALPSGIALLVGGLGLTLMCRPRRTATAVAA